MNENKVKGYIKEWWDMECSEVQRRDMAESHGMRMPISMRNMRKLYMIYALESGPAPRCGYWGTCNHKGENNACMKHGDCGSKIEK